LNTWATTGNMLQSQSLFQLALLPNGQVLAAGEALGIGPLATTEIYNPTTGTWSATGNLTTRRADYALSVLPKGKILLAGGVTTVHLYGTTNSAEIYDPATGTWSLTGSMGVPRFADTGVQLPDLRVLVAGGQSSEDLGCPPCGNLQSSAELYDLGSGTWLSAGKMASVRAYQYATLLPDGEILQAGGRIMTGGGTATAELYKP
jgi:hypothetical protein